MSRSQYDTDVTTFSPQGRLHQLEYAIEAVKQGSASVGIRTNTHAVIVSLKRSNSELASFQEKVFKVDTNIGIAVSGLIADARVLSKYMHDESLNHRFVFGSTIQVPRLVQMVADKSQTYTQTSSKRPYGVGLLVIGYDKTGPHLFETDPSGNFFEYRAQSIGARSQAAKTFLEKHIESFPSLTLEQAIVHALTALRGTSQAGEYSEKSVTVGYVGKDTPFTLATVEEVRRWTHAVESDFKEEKKEEKEEEEKDEELAQAEQAVAQMGMDQS